MFPGSGGLAHPAKFPLKLANGGCHVRHRVRPTGVVKRAGYAAIAVDAPPAMIAAMSDDVWIWGVRLAGAGHLVTVAFAHFTPIPARWDENLASLPEVHRRFAIAQNGFIGATMIFAGIVSLCFARELVAGSTAARIICVGIALWWGGRLVVLPWLRVWPELRTPFLRAGFVWLHLQCAVFGLAYAWLAFRGR